MTENELSKKESSQLLEFAKEIESAENSRENAWLKYKDAKRKVLETDSHLVIKRDALSCLQELKLTKIENICRRIINKQNTFIPDDSSEHGRIKQTAIDEKSLVAKEILCLILE